MSEYHEPAHELSQEARSLSRALRSLKEEIEAVEWYAERVDVEQNQELKKIMEHNMKEEMEHAAMSLEWLRRNMDGWDKYLKDFLFKDGEISH